jgi:hypothetical protein
MLSLTDLSLLELHAQSADLTKWQGHTALRLENGLALLPFTAQDLALEAWIGADGPCYPGLIFRAQDENNCELVYAQPHTSGGWDALQYDPLFNGGNTWQNYHGPAYQQSAEVPTGRWFRLRVYVQGERMSAAIDDQPPLVVEKLAHAAHTGRVGLWTYLPAYYRDLRLLSASEIHNQGTQPQLPPGAITAWDLEGVGPVTCELNGILNLNRWLPLSASPARLVHVLQLFRPGEIELSFGFSDRLRLSVDGQELFEGENLFQGMPAGYAGRGYVRPDHYRLRLPLLAGPHRLEAEVTAVEPFGWGFACRLSAEPAGQLD